MPVRLSRERETKRRMRKGEKPAPPLPQANHPPKESKKVKHRGGVAKGGWREKPTKTKPKKKRHRNPLFLAHPSSRPFVRSFVRLRNAAVLHGQLDAASSTKGGYPADQSACARCPPGMQTARTPRSQRAMTRRPLPGGADGRQIEDSPRARARYLPRNKKKTKTKICRHFRSLVTGSLPAPAIMQAANEGRLKWGLME